MFSPKQRKYPIEWRNDRVDRFTLLTIYAFDTDRARVALAAYEAQRAERERVSEDGGRRP